MSFDALLADLQALQTESESLVKSMPTSEEDQKVKKAAEHSEPDEDDENPEEDDGDEDNQEMSKSFLTDADGNPVEVIDATDLI